MSQQKDLTPETRAVLDEGATEVLYLHRPALLH